MAACHGVDCETGQIRHSRTENAVVAAGADDFRRLRSQPPQAPDDPLRLHVGGQMTFKRAPTLTDRPSVAKRGFDPRKLGGMMWIENPPRFYFIQAQPPGELRPCDSGVPDREVERYFEFWGVTESLIARTGERSVQIQCNSVQRHQVSRVTSRWRRSPPGECHLIASFARSDRADSTGAMSPRPRSAVLPHRCSAARSFPRADTPERAIHLLSRYIRGSRAVGSQYSWCVVQGRGRC